jgi:hypothetical protein
VLIARRLSVDTGSKGGASMLKREWVPIFEPFQR